MQFLQLLISDGDGLVLAIIEILFPIFIGLKEPEEDYYDYAQEGNGEDINHGF